MTYPFLLTDPVEVHVSEVQDAKRTYRAAMDKLLEIQAQHLAAKDAVEKSGEYLREAQRALVQSVELDI
jgi:hypothetical protein